MKTKSTSKSERTSNFIFVFLTSLGLGYTLVNHFIFDKPRTETLVVMILFVCNFYRFLATKKNHEEITAGFNHQINQSIINQLST